MLKKILIIFLLFSTISTLFYILYLGSAKISLRLIMDDAFYYYQVAYNIANGYGSSFDRIHYTNGYHPLWMIIITPISFLIENKDYFIIAIIIIQFLLFWVGVYNGVQALKQGLSLPIEIPLLITFIIIISTPIFSKMFLGGLESALYWATIMIALNCSRIAFQGQDTGKWRLYGLTLGIVFLARIDGLVIVANWFFFMVLIFINGYQSNRVNILRNTINALCPCILIILFYLAWNLINYGHLLTSSAAIKVSLSLETKYIVLSIPLICLWVLFSWVGSYPRNKHLYYILPYITFALIYLPVLFILGPAEFGRIWYHIPSMISLWIFSSIILNFFWKKIQTRDFGNYCNRYFIVLACLFFTIVGFVYLNNFLAPSRFTKWIHVHSATLWLSKIASPNDIVASFDGGRIGFSLTQRTINLDGLANSHDFKNVINNRSLWDYLIKNHVRYIINHINGTCDLISARLKPLDPNAPWNLRTKVIYDDLFDDPREGKRRIQIIEIIQNDSLTINN